MAGAFLKRGRPCGDTVFKNQLGIGCLPRKQRIDCITEAPHSHTGCCGYDTWIRDQAERVVLAGSLDVGAVFSEPERPSTGSSDRQHTPCPGSRFHKNPGSERDLRRGSHTRRNRPTIRTGIDADALSLGPASPCEEIMKGTRARPAGGEGLSLAGLTVGEQA